jgi:large subunit ribosomal protein L10
MAAVVRRTAHLPEWKKNEVQELINSINSRRVVCVVGMREIPASDLQQIRAELRGKLDLRMVRNNIARRAMEAAGGEISLLADYIEDQTALVFSNENPFQLYALLEKGKRPMPIKAGARAPKDIVIESGETSFSPGPMVGKLQAAGIPAAIKGGKVVVSNQVKLVKEGEVVSAKVADILKAMEIFPKKVGLNLRAAYEGGLIFKPEDLTLDIEGLLSQLGSTSAAAMGFAVKVGYATPETIAPILQLAQAKARSLVAEAGIPVPGMMELVLARAAANALAITSLVRGEAAPAKAAEAAISPAAKGMKGEAPKKEEKKTEEKKEEEDTAAGLGALFG